MEEYSWGLHENSGCNAWYKFPQRNKPNSQLNYYLSTPITMLFFKY